MGVLTVLPACMCADATGQFVYIFHLSLVENTQWNNSKWACESRAIVMTIHKNFTDAYISLLASMS